MSLSPSRPLVGPLSPSAVYVFADLEALDSVYAGESDGFIYARDGHPNAAELSQRVAVFEQAAWATIHSSGMAAISTALLSVCRPGGRIVASHRLYGRTTQLLTQELPRFGVDVVCIDTCDLSQVAVALEQPTQAVFVETMSNPMLRLADVPTLARLCQKHACRLIVDNTFATPLLFRPLDHGADLVIESLTKLMAGHSDVTLGSVAGRDADLLVRIRQVSSIWGFSASPFDCWLAQRGLETLALRVRAATDNASRLAAWLRQQPTVMRVVYPESAEHPDHELAARLLPAGCGNMIAFEIVDGRAGVDRFLRTARRIPFSPSLGHTTTTCSYPAGTSHRYDSTESRQQQGISDGLIRLSVGIEDWTAIRDALAEGLTMHDHSTSQ